MGIAANVALVLSGSWVKWVNAALVPAAGGSTQVRGLLRTAHGMRGCEAVLWPSQLGRAAAARWGAPPATSATLLLLAPEHPLSHTPPCS